MNPILSSNSSDRAPSDSVTHRAHLVSVAHDEPIVEGTGKGQHYMEGLH